MHAYIAYFINLFIFLQKSESANSRLSYQVPVFFAEYYSDIEFLVIYLAPIIPAFMSHDARHHRACTNIYLFI